MDHIMVKLRKPLCPVYVVWVPARAVSLAVVAWL